MKYSEKYLIVKKCPRAITTFQEYLHKDFCFHSELIWTTNRLDASKFRPSTARGIVGYIYNRFPDEVWGRFYIEYEEVGASPK